MTPRMQELLTQIRAQRQPQPQIQTTTPKDPNLYTSEDKYGNPITLNEKQSEAVRRVLAGESIVLIGAAGTGKTTAQKEIVRQLILSGKAGIGL